MTTEQARRLKTAVTMQDQMRRRLINAEGADEIRIYANGYIEATDHCYEIACQVTGDDQ